VKDSPLDEGNKKDEILRDLSNLPSNEYIDDGSTKGDEEDLSMNERFNGMNVVIKERFNYCSIKRWIVKYSSIFQTLHND